MNSREQGYEDDRFENVVSQNFHCPICLNVFKDPVMCQRNQHNFCRLCITRHLENSQRCPSCQDELTSETLNKAPRILTDYLSELKIRCDYFSRGCREFVQLGNLERHVKDCGFTPVLCSDEKCRLEINKRDRIHHETEVCEFRKVKCHNCFEIRKEVNEVKVHLKTATEKLEHLEMKVDYKMEEMKVDVATVKDKLDCLDTNMEENRNMFERLTTDIQKTQEQIMKLVSGTENDTNNIKPSVVVAGGSALCTLEMFDLSKRTWLPLPPMKECRNGATSFIYQNQLTVAGGVTNHGCTDNMETIKTNPIMDSTQWTDFPAKLPGKLSGHSSVVYNERLITIGGYDGCNRTCSDSIHEILLVQPHTRNLVSTMPRPRCYHGAQLCNNDKILIIGGTPTGLFKNSFDSVLMYDINKTECKEMPPLPFAVSQMATVGWSDNAIVIGGIDKQGEVLNTVVIYNVQTGKSHMLPEMKCKRRGCTAAVSRGAIVVMGGEDENGEELNLVECFTFDRYSWEDLPPMNEARWWATAVGW